MHDDAMMTALKALLTARGFAADAITINVTVGPLPAEFIRATAPSDRPGVGIATAIRAGGRLFSTALGHGIGALVAECGWFEAPPSASELLAALAFTDFDGMLDADGPEPLQLTSGANLRLTGSVREPFDDAPRRLTLVVRPGGIATIQFSPLAPPESVPRAIDLITAAVRALDGGGIEAIAAMRQLAGNADQRAISALVRATARWEEALWVEALGGLSPSDPTLAAALNDAWRSLDEAAFGERIDVAESLHGAAFAGALRRGRV